MTRDPGKVVGGGGSGWMGGRGKAGRGVDVGKEEKGRGKISRDKRGASYKLLVEVKRDGGEE